MTVLHAAGVGDRSILTNREGKDAQRVSGRPDRVRHATYPSRRPGRTKPAPNEVLVRVRASSANRADNSIAAGMLKQMGSNTSSLSFSGRGYAGVVEQVGVEVTRYTVGVSAVGAMRVGVKQLANGEPVGRLGGCPVSVDDR